MQMRRRGYVPLMTKIVCLFFAVILLACVVISIFSFRMESERQLEEKRNQSLLLLRTMAQDVSGRTAQLEIVAQELAYDSEIRELLQEEDVGRYILRVLFSVQRRMEISESHLATLGADIVLLEEDDAMPESYECVVHASRLNDNAFFAKFKSSDSVSGWGPIERALSFTGSTAPVVPYYQRVPSSMGNTVGMILCTAQADRLFYSPGEWSGGIRVLHDGESVYAVNTVDWVMPQELRSGAWVEEDTLYAATELTGMDLTLLMAQPLAPVWRKGVENALLAVALVFLTGLILLMITAVLTKRMLSRLEMMRNAANSLPEGKDLTAALPEAGPDEAGQLADGFSSLITRVNSYYQQLLVEEKSKRRAQRLALQLQMNPHFLFNSLYWLQLQMECEGMSEALSDSVAHLGQVLHYNLEGSLSALLSEEEAHIKAYVSFMGAMKGGQFLLTVDIPDALMDHSIPRFTLQPLLENAIHHGYVNDRPLHLDVCVWAEDESVCIRVENDGKPIPPDQLTQLRDVLSRPGQTPENGSIGLRNLKRRLELTYGADAIMTVESSEARTAIQIKLPPEKHGGEEAR